MIQPWSVAKFGGTSMADLAAMKKSASVLQAHPQAKLVVVSATSGSTNALLEMIECIQKKNFSLAQEKREAFELKHLLMAEDIGLEGSLKKLLRGFLDQLRQYLEGISLVGVCPPEISDAIVGTGELISSVLFTAVLRTQNFNAEWFDVREVMRTDDRYQRAQALPEEIEVLAKEKLIPLLGRGWVVTQGFIGRDCYGKTTTLGRGGSDYSAALLAEAVDAQELQIWTDVSGMYTCDPRLIPDAEPIDKISFEESAEMSQLGAKVLHPATLWPAVRKNIPVFVGNSQRPTEKKGTIIEEKVDSKPLFRALAMKKNQTLVTVKSLKMVAASGFLEKVFSIFGKYKISVDQITTGQIRVAMTVEEPQLLTPDFLAELGSLGSVEVEQGLCLIGLIGNDLSKSPGAVARVFSLLSDYPIRLICHGGGQHNLSFLVSPQHGEEILKKIHPLCLEGRP